MRVVRVAVCAAALAVAGLSQARAAEVQSCASYAQDAADEWAAGRIARADDATMMEPGRVIVIAYGHKYSVPRRQMDDPNLHLKPLGQLAIERTRVYYDELRRCQGHMVVHVLGNGWYAARPETSSDW